MVGTGSSNGGLINRDDGTVGVGNKVGVQVEGTTIAVSNWGSVGIDSTNSDGSSNNGSSSDGSGGNNGSSSSVGGSLGSKVVSTGGGNGRFVSRDNGSVGVGDQVGVQVEGTGVAVARGVGTSVANSGNGSSSNDRGGSNNGSSSGKSSSLGGEVVGTGSSNGRLVSGDHSSVGVSDQVGVEVEGTGVTISRSVGRDGNGSSSVANLGDRGGGGNNGTGSELGGQMVGLQSSHTGLVNGGERSVGVSLQAKETLGGGKGETGGENLKGNFNSLFTPFTLSTHQKLHGVFGCVLELKLRRLSWSDLL